jgi:hypothetical protein
MSDYFGDVAPKTLEYFLKKEKTVERPAVRWKQNCEYEVNV